MEQIFHGPWSVQVIQKSAAYSQQFRIVGSDNSDGTYSGVLGTPILLVTGAEWKLLLEWNDNNGSGWQPSEVLKTQDFTNQRGFVITLGADDAFNGDKDFNDLVVECISLDPDFAPTGEEPFDYSIPNENLIKGKVISKRPLKGGAKQAAKKRK